MTNRPTEPRAVLAVCLGNICRSPAAEAVLRARAEAAGAALAVDSAGIGGWHAGEPPDRRMQAAARARGLDLSGQRARQVAAADFARFDASDMMPGAVGAGSFWTEAVNYIQRGGEDLDTMLSNIDASWP